MTRSYPRTGADFPHMRRLLRVSLFYKILIANAVLVAASSVLGGLVVSSWARTHGGGEPGHLVLPLVVLGVALSVVVNGVIVRLALEPLRELEDTAREVQAGDLGARAPESPLSDAELEGLVRTFNAMLDGLAEYRERLRKLAAQALTAAEEERKRIARELHDETAQMLAALLIRLRVLQRTEDPARRVALLEEVREEVSQALDGVRRFARGLRPPALDELGLVPALEAYARGLAEAVGIGLDLDGQPLEGVLRPEAELALYRIVQEALTNVARHAQASRVKVRVAREDGRVVASVEDDGMGFAVGETMSETGKGLGLFGMQERASYVGGRVAVESEPGRGTRVVAEIPVREGGAGV